MFELKSLSPVWKLLVLTMYPGVSHEQVIGSAIFLLIGISGCFCPCVLSCYLAKLYGENFMTALLPGGLTALRTHIRLSYKIEGTVCNDALIICCCGPCEVCRMTREVRKHVQ
uniref:Uncharacterized protein n=1 Tax=Callorhinchus milii TaxID=7868 RepID=A0A4W3IPR0_CALMI